MIYIGHADGTPVSLRTSHCSTGGAESWASRNLGAGWRARGYRVCYATDYSRWETEKSKSKPRKWLDRVLSYAKRKAMALGDMQLKEFFGFKTEYFWGKHKISRKEWRQFHGWE